MQLTSLEIHGFKSFADKTKFVFDNGVTGVVGPNGCGKSNIVDSIRWVLGEQKTTALRSEKMENVIFNGTEKRKKANICSVSLTFENTKNILPTEYTTVTITRRLYRTGESEYLINEVPCRLKDIQNLFLDTGIGPDSYAIIELKMVDDILNDKNNARRILFEEAAGISKYKVRKKQTLRKLEETQADLERVQDILFEIEKNLKSLEAQARKARRYFELKDAYKLLSARFAWFTIRDLRGEYEAIEKEETEGNDLMTAIQASIAGHDARIQELRKQQLDNEVQLSEAQKDLNRHVAHIQDVERDKSIRNERLKYLQQREFAIAEQLETEKQLREKTLIELDQVRQLLAQVSQDFTGNQSLLDNLRQRLESLRAANEQEKTATDSRAREHRELEQNLASLKRELEIRSIQIEAMGHEIRRNEEDKSTKHTELGAFAETLIRLDSEAAALEHEVAELKSRKAENEAEIQRVTTNIETLKDSIYRTSRLLDARSNEFELTRSLVENLEGFPESVKFLKNEAGWLKDAPLLSDVFTAGEEFKVAFENLLEPYLNYYVVNSRADALQAVKLLGSSSKGRANFFILDELSQYEARPAQSFPGASPALGIAEFRAEHRKLAEFLLDKVYVVDDENAVPDSIPADSFFITRSGTLVRRKYSLSGGSIGLFQGKRLGRAQNLEKLEQEIRKFESELNEIKTTLDGEERNLALLRQSNLDAELERRNNLLQEKRQDLFVMRAREQEYMEFIQRAGERTEVIERQIATLRTETAEIAPRITEATEQLASQTTVLEEARLALERSNAELAQVSEEYNKHHISFIQVKNRMENLQKDAQQMEERAAALEVSSNKLREEGETTRREIHELVDSTLQNDEEMVALYEEKKRHEDIVNQMEQTAAKIRMDITAVEDEIRGERHRKDEIETRRNQIRDKVTDIKIRLNSLKERMEVEFQVDINELDEAQLFEKGLENYELIKVEDEMLKMRNRLQNYGEINPMAVEAFNEMKERFDFITAQKKDLEDAKAALVQTIAEIDQTATEKFNESFNLIREHFIRVFRSLFNEGDTCDLVLENNNDPLESEITILAKPKGKRPLTINQLSGGEKTLTAISLLFAIYLLKPAPFCIFDEVDAPLDDANIDKFNNIVREFSGESQFIIVTHNKRTMTSTNVMYGVTMEEQGVSKVLPVDLIALNLN